jgi:hypothetical protein
MKRSRFTDSQNIDTVKRVEASIEFTNDFYSTIVQTWQRFKTLQRSGCGFTTMIAQTCPWTGSRLGSGWPWLLNVATSATLAKGEDYSLKARPNGPCLVFKPYCVCTSLSNSSRIENGPLWP